jgi:hypothetical protein
MLLQRGGKLFAHFRGHPIGHVQELPQVWVVRGIGLVMPERGRERWAVPRCDGVGRRQGRAIDINHRRVGGAEFVHPPQRLGVDIFRDRLPAAASLGQPDQFLQPGRAGRLYMDPGIELPDCPTDGAIERELVATGMDA